MNETMKVFDCFAGCGGFRLGFEKEGFKIIGHCEIDKYTTMLYQSYFNTKNEVFYKDANKIETKTMPDFDIFTGGFPCQSFSVAGKRQGFKDTRGTLFFETARICQDKKPKYIILENVKGLLSHDNGRTFSTIIGVLADIGYSVEWQVLNSKFFGVPFNRERVFIFGCLGKKSKPKIFPIRKSVVMLAKTSETSSQKYFCNYTARHPITRRQLETTYILTNNGIRALTPLEAFRLQSFPDDLVLKAYEIGISDTQLYKMAGNAVTVNVVQEIAKRIKER